MADGSAHLDSSPPHVAVNKPRCDQADALWVLRRLRDAGFVSYFAGGCVRDLLLGAVPKDWDVATDATPDRVRALFHNTQGVGAAFGVILVRYRGSVIEVATFRADADYHDGRRPSAVRFTGAEEDARRRDFTINGLFLDPLRSGPLAEQVIDYVGGRDDLAARVIRAVGDAEARFGEDHLRMLRAVRFAARLQFDIEPTTTQAIIRHAGQIIRISPERIADELRAMLTPPSRASAYRRLERLELRRPLFRFLDSPAGQLKSARPGSIFERLNPGQPIGFGLALAGAGVDHSLWSGRDAFDVRQIFEHAQVQKLVRAFRQSLKISNEESAEMAGALAGLDPLLREIEPTVATLKRFLARPTADDSRALLDATADLLNPSRVRFLQARLAELSARDFAPPPFITGEDLSAAGLLPGPLFKRVLDAVYDAQLEDHVATREAALAMALSLAGRHG